MRKVIFGINITTDGYCDHTGPMSVDDTLHEYFTNMLRKASVILYGRKTYQLMVPYWPDVAKNQSESAVTNEFARVFDSLDKILFSTTLNQADDKHTRLARTNLVEEVLSLKEQPGKDIAVGSLSIASQLSTHGLIDEYSFVVHPAIAGKGPRLFENMTMQNPLQLEFTGSEIFSSGTVALQYKKRK